MHEGGFFFQAFVYLAAAVIAVPLAKRMGLGSVLGYLLAGVVIGPFGLRLVGEESGDVMHFAEFGVVLMLFVVGLELEPALLLRLRKPILGLGGLQVVATSVAGTIGARMFGLDWRPAIAVGMILALSSTALVLQMMTEKGLLKTGGGQSSFAVLLFQDIAVIPMIALFPLLASGGGHAAGEEHGNWVSTLPGWGKTIVVLGAVALIVVSGRYLLRPAFRAIAATRLRELFTAAALLLVIGVAILMTIVGLSPALGTFLAGVILANSEYRHELESDLEPFKGLLLGLFFLAVGASIDFAFVAAKPGLILGIVGLVLLGKGLILFALGRSFGLGTDQTLLFTFALPQVGEFAFVLLSYGVGLSLLPREIGDTLVAVVAISMGLTPLAMIAYERLVAPRVGTREKTTREADEVTERNEVIIAGFGRFGNTVGRLLMANGVGCTILDNDSDRVELLRRLGIKVFYGDATRHDLLHAAGAGEARLIVLALDSPERNRELVRTVRKHFPRLAIFARALDRPDAYDLIEEGISNVYRETVDTSLRLGVDALRALGFRAYHATRAARKFLRHDEEALRELAAVRSDRAAYIDVARSRIEDLERTLLADLHDSDLERDAGWDPDTLREDARQGGLSRTSPEGARS